MVSEQQPLIFSNTNTDFQHFLIGGPKGNEQYSYMFTTHSFIACLGKKPTIIKNIFIKTASHYKSLGFSRKIISYPDSVSIAGRQFKLGRQFPIFHTNLKRSNFSTRGLYYSPCFTVFLQCQHGTAFIPCSSAPHSCWGPLHALGLTEKFPESLALLRSKAPQNHSAMGVKEIHVKLSAAHFLCWRLEGADGLYVKCDVWRNSMCYTQVIYKLITRHNFWQVLRLPNAPV